MSNDARFEEGAESPLNLGAFDSEDLKVLSSLVQDAVFPRDQMTWKARDRRFAILLNRFRWEDNGRARHAPERVQSVLVIENVLGVSSEGIDPRSRDGDTVLSLLALGYEGEANADGHVIVTLAGDATLRIRVEALELRLRDVTRPYVAPSGKVPDHAE